jgi:hypothetical protein
MSNMLKQTMDHDRVDGGATRAAEGSSTMTTKGWTSRTGSDRTMCGEAAYQGVSLLLDERMRAAADARRADDRTRPGAYRSLRTRTGLALVALGTRIGGRALERPSADTLPSPTLARHARAGRAG